jgi:hypothetical protein
VEYNSTFLDVLGSLTPSERLAVRELPPPAARTHLERGSCPLRRVLKNFFRRSEASRRRGILVVHRDIFIYNVSLINMNMKLAAKRILPLVYFLAVSLPHHPFSTWLDKTILYPYGFEVLQRSADILSIVLLAVVVGIGIRVAGIHRMQAVRHFGIWLLLLILMYVADRLLIVNNIERIHFPQYAVLSLLLGFSLRSEKLIFFTSSFAGFVDELLQYIMKPDHTNYLDFNDIVLNMLGAGIGIALLIGLRKPSSTEIQKYEKRFRIVFVTILLAFGSLVGAALVLDRFIFVADQLKPRNVFSIIDGKLSFIMSFERHDQFWQRSPAHGKAYHVLSPFEGLSIIFLLSIFTWWWTRALRRERSDEKDEGKRKKEKLKRCKDKRRGG